MVNIDGNICSIHRSSLLLRTLADNDKDGRLTSDEFIIAMHCCEIVRTGQTLPTRLPDEWTKGTQTLRDRTGSLSRTNITPAFASLNQDLKDIMKSSSTNENHSPETVENERKNNVITYEERRQKNYEVWLISLGIQVRRGIFF